MYIIIILYIYYIITTQHYKFGVMAELFVVGEVLGASGFNGNNLVCKYAVAFGENWRLSEGEASGQTQTDYPKV